MTTTGAELATMTPAQIDTLLAPIAGAEGAARAAAYDLTRSALRAVSAGSAARYTARAAEQDARAAELALEAAPYRAEFTRRGGWARIYWCTANGGHAHSSTACRSLYVTTGIVWLPELSGKDEAELVELAGDAACTFCYPTAPVATADPSQLAPAREAREAKAARDAELTAKRAEKAAKAIANPDGSTLRDASGWEVKTVVSAWKAAVEPQADAQLYGYSYGPEKAAAVARIVEALAVKLGRTEDDVRAEVARKLAAKIKRG